MRSLVKGIDKLGLEFVMVVGSLFFAKLIEFRRDYM